MKGGNLSSLLIAVIMTSIIVIGMSSFFVDIASNPAYNLSVTKLETPIEEGGFGNFSTFRQIKEITKEAEEIKESTEKMTKDIPSMIVGFLTGAINTIGLIFGSVSIFGNMISDAMLIIGLPPWLGMALIAIVIIIIVFTILSAVMKWRL